jgi:drug/metabolite transporter (DMT)-like permease
VEEYMDLQVRALLAGLFFGLWPLFMNRSGLKGNISSTIFIAVVLVVLLPFSWNTDFSSLRQANWVMLVSAAVLSAIGLLFYNSMLTQASKENVGALFLMMIMVQLSVPAINVMVTSQKFSASKTGGIIAAIIAVLLLNK